MKEAKTSPPDGVAARTTPVNASRRVEWIDMLKAVGMVLVVFGHTPAFAEPYWVYSFHMPLFFIVVGLLFPDRLRLNLPTFVRRRAYRRLMPYLIYSIIAVLLFNLVLRHFGRFAGPPISLRDYLGGIRNGFPLADIVLWFYPVLFGAEVVAAVVVASAKSKTMQAAAFIGLVAIAGLTGGTNLRYVQFGSACVMSGVFILAGIYARGAMGAIRDFRLAGRALVFIAALAVSIWLATIQVHAMHQRSDLGTASYGNVIIYIACACAGTLACASLCFEFERARLGFVASIGKATGVIFPLHDPLHPFITAFIVFGLRQPNTVQDHSWGWGIFYIVVTFAVLWPLHGYLKKTRFAAALGL